MALVATKEQERYARIPFDGGTLPAVVVPAEDATGTVVIVDGTGSGFSHSGNRYIARVLGTRGMTAVLVDVCAEDGGRPPSRFGATTPEIAHRIQSVLHWVDETSLMSDPVGIVGLGTGAAAALVAAARTPHQVRVAVCCDGHPDVAGGALARVSAPTLFVVRDDDRGLLERHERAAARMKCIRSLQAIVPAEAASLDAAAWDPSAAGLTLDPSELNEVAAAAASWLEYHLVCAGSDDDELL